MSVHEGEMSVSGVAGLPYSEDREKPTVVMHQGTSGSGTGASNEVELDGSVVKGLDQGYHLVILTLAMDIHKPRKFSISVCAHLEANTRPSYHALKAFYPPSLWASYEGQAGATWNGADANRL
ncbi:hypothetical protein BV22DRAFT_1052193 [Leucogyrophana mollusca]|uniref:Uncharacterized protein n=1 Tax=Leucogyrophana mollusca TaxID=85980 RepID=A0ACB8AWX2_9AGAM|nr:hypothetical protein BV22DRAFT_1052193 [Leucogyrophana mollusca]